ncbi:MAG: glycosyltransferase [Candidatus Eisenbacteria bacterium]|nr:glycosyltransferase [Candidatus Eisenbacteria bacterium]
MPGSRLLTAPPSCASFGRSSGGASADAVTLNRETIALRVLFIGQDLPGRRRTGGQIATFYQISQLARAGHGVTFLTIVPDGTVSQDAELGGLADVIAVPELPKVSTAGYLRGLTDPLPVPIRRYTSRRFLARVAEAAAERYDLIFFNSLHSAPALPAAGAASDAPAVLFEHNVQSTVMRLFADFQASSAARLYATLQWRRMERYEASVLPLFDLTLTFSDVDRRALEEMSEEARVEAVPLAIDVGALPEPPHAEENDVLFVGSFGWRPNQDSLRWFLEEILPAIRATRPGTTVTVVGSPVPQWASLLAGGDGRVSFVGDVDDVFEHFARSRVLVVPLRIGSGVRVKIIQAMAMGKAVVTTTKGCEGLHVEHDREVRMADDPRSFAREVTSVLDDDGLRERLGAAARKLAFAEHDATSDDSPLVKACERLARGRGRSS